MVTYKLKKGIFSQIPDLFRALVQSLIRKIYSLGFGKVIGRPYLLRKKETALNTVNLQSIRQATNKQC